MTLRLSSLQMPRYLALILLFLDFLLIKHIYLFRNFYQLIISKLILIQLNYKMSRFELKSLSVKICSVFYELRYHINFSNRQNLPYKLSRLNLHFDYFAGSCSSYYRGSETPYLSNSCLQSQTWPLHHLSYPAMIQSSHPTSKQTDSLQTSSEYVSSGPYSPLGQYSMSMHNRASEQSLSWNHSMIYP